MSGPGDGHAFDADGGGGAGSAEDEVVADGDDVAVHVFEVAGDGDLFDGVGELAVLDPHAAGALGVVAGDEVDAVAHGLGDVEAALYVADDLLGGEGSGFEVEVAGADAGVSGEPARGVAGGVHVELARGVGVHDVVFEDAAFDEHGAAGGKTFAVEGAGAEAADAVSVFFAKD